MDTLFSMAMAAYQSISDAQLKQGMVDRLLSLADVLDAAGFKKKPAVKKVNSLGTLDWTVNAQNISLAWGYLHAIEDEKANELKKIEKLVDELFEAIPNELEKQKTAKKKADQLAAEKVAKNKQATSEAQGKAKQAAEQGAGKGVSGTKDKANKNLGSGDAAADEATHTIKSSVGTVKFNGRYLSGDVVLSDDEAAELAAFLD